MGMAPELERITAFMGQSAAAADYLITVGPHSGVKAGVKIRQRFCSFNDPYILGEEAVQGRYKTGGVHFFNSGIKIGNLSGGMYPGVGPARTAQSYFFLMHFFQGCFDNTLHGPFRMLLTVPLPLPSGKIGAIISYKEFNIS